MLGQLQNNNFNNILKVLLIPMNPYIIELFNIKTDKKHTMKHLNI